MAAARRAEQRLRRRADFMAVLRHGRRARTRLMRVTVLDNGLDHNRYGFAVSRRVGGAVVRNRTKRRLREIVYQVRIAPGHDVLVTADPSSANASFQELTRAFETVSQKISNISGNLSN